MQRWVERFKPRASRRQQLFLAAALWTVVGVLLFIFGSRWALEDAGARRGAGFVILGLVIGLIKGHFILDRAARRITTRILDRGDNRCVGGFLSWKSWLLVAIMMFSGRILRGGILPPTLVGTLYGAIGAGLAFSSRIAWRRWRGSDVA